MPNEGKPEHQMRFEETMQKVLTTPKGGSKNRPQPSGKEAELKPKKRD